MRIEPNTPPSLGEILEKFKQAQSSTEEGKELLKKINDSEKRFHDGYAADDIKLQMSPGMDNHLHKDRYLDACIEYMGLTFYWHEKQKSDLAWYYYAQAQRYWGICISWDYAIDYLIQKDLDRQNRAKGGQKKLQKTTKPLMDAFSKVIEEKKPVNGWKNKKELISIALPVLEDVRTRLGPDSFPLHENLERTMNKWLTHYCDAMKCYHLNAANDNDDIL